MSRQGDGQGDFGKGDFGQGDFGQGDSGQGGFEEGGFEEGESDEVWIGSADLMHRNLDRRVEALVRVTDPKHEAELRNLIDYAMSPGVASWWLGPDGTWTRHHLDDSGKPLIDLQEHLIQTRQSRNVEADVAAAKSRLGRRRLERHE